MSSQPTTDPSARIAALQAEIERRGAREAALFLEQESDGDIAAVLSQLAPGVATDMVESLPPARREAVLGATDPDRAAQWRANIAYPPDTVGRLMEPPIAVFEPGMTVAAAIERLREQVRRAFITYGYVVDPDGRLLGLLVFRELLFADPAQQLAKVMLREPFSLRPDTTIGDAMKQVVSRHFPVYPITDRDGRLVGVMRGQTLFQAQAFDISAQAGRMVGVEKEERVQTPVLKSLLSRHPWLQLNLLTAFVAAAVVGTFQGTIDRIVILAAFLPVLAGQSGNTGCQALAVCLRAMTIGDLKDGEKRRIVVKEATLGLLNGMLVGVTAGLGMFFYARSQSNPSALLLGGIVMAAMTMSCIVSGVSGATIPIVLKRLGADPATASSIFLTTATDVVSMGLFLGLATLLIPA